MWFKLAKFSTFLFASSTSNTNCRPRLRETATKASQGAANPTSRSSPLPPQTAMELSYAFRKIYLDLERPGLVNSEVTPTLRFSYVTPPINGTSTWNIDNLEKSNDLYPDQTKPIAVYLPGLDGYGLSACNYQFDDLATSFELWRLIISPEDRSSFMDVVQAISDFVEDMARGGRKITLIGESCGGLFASAVAQRLQRLYIENADKHPLVGLVLVNPATSYDKTFLDALAPVLTSLQYLEANYNGVSPYAVIGSLFLSSVIPDNDQYKRIFNTIASLPNLNIPSTDPNQLVDILDAMADAFRATEERLPPDLLKHRLSWTNVGSSIVNPRLHQIQLPTLVVVGDQDKLLPSADEADRLLKELPFSEKLVVKGRGHIVLDENVNLTEAILYSKIDPLNWKETKKRYDPILDWNGPSAQRMEDVINGRLKQLRTAHSPIFFSTDNNGKRWLGLSKLPRPEEPLLFVGNHQFAGLDLTMLLGQMLEDRNILARGLAHPVTFMSGSSELRGRVPGLLQDNGQNQFTSDFQEFGAVPVTPRNFYRLLQSGQDTLLFPGGAREALSGNKDYPLLWPDKVDFVRTAARFNATIVPFGAVGLLDSFNVVLEEIPAFGQNNSTTPAARYDEKNQTDLTPPLALPSIPARNYFLFCEPISTKDIDPRDKDACAQVYQKAKADVRRVIDDLIRARAKDPFSDTLKRVAYEKLIGRKAPTFPLEHLN